MKQLFITLILALLSSGWVNGLAQEAATNATTNAVAEVESSTNQVRQLKPFVLKNSDGREVKYAEAYKGKMLLIFFFTSWAKPCQDQVPALVELQKQFEGKHFSVLGISLDERGGREVRLFAQKNKVNFPILMGDMLLVQDVGGVAALPTLCLVDQNRMLLMKEASVTDKPTLEEILKKVRENQQ